MEDDNKQREDSHIIMENLPFSSSSLRNKLLPRGAASTWVHKLMNSWFPYVDSSNLTCNGKFTKVTQCVISNSFELKQKFLHVSKVNALVQNVFNLKVTQEGNNFLRNASAIKLVGLLSDTFEKFDEDGHERSNDLLQNNNSTLLSPNWASVFLCGEMIGASSLSLSKALQDTGFYTGLGIYLIITCVSGTFAFFLCKTYTRLRRTLKNSLNGAHIRDPYPQLAYAVLGRVARLLVVGCIIFSDFLGTAALILLPADMLVRSFEIKLLPNHSVKQNMRLWVFVGTIIITPFTWNDRPKDNKFVAMLSLVSAAIGNVLIVTMYAFVSTVESSSAPSNAPESSYNYIVAIGLLLTTADGFDVMPNIVEDMRDVNDYKKVILRSYLMFSLLNLPVMIGGYLLFHKHHILSENIIIELVRESAKMRHPMKFVVFRVIAYTTLTLYVVHIKMTTVLQLNPTFQYMERFFPCREGLCWQRCLLRTVILVLVMLFVIAAPNLLPILSFNGSILYVLLGLVIPGLMYMKVFEHLAIYRKAFILSIISVFIAYLAINTYYNVRTIAKSDVNRL